MGTGDRGEVRVRPNKLVISHYKESLLSNKTECLFSMTRPSRGPLTPGSVDPSPDPHTPWVTIFTRTSFLQVFSKVKDRKLERVG